MTPWYLNLVFWLLWWAWLYLLISSEVLAAFLFHWSYCSQPMRRERIHITKRRGPIGFAVRSIISWNWPLLWKWTFLNILYYHDWKQVFWDILVIIALLLIRPIYRGGKRIGKAIGAKARALRDKLVANMPSGKALPA